MRCEDLFHAIGMVEENRLSKCERFRNASMVNHRDRTKTNTGHIKKVWLVAALITLMLFLMGSTIVSLIRMETEEVNLQVPSPKPQTGETVESHEDTSEIQPTAEETTESFEVHKGEIVDFEKQEDVYIELGPYYPQTIPDGYTMTFVTEGAPLQNQRIDYENEAGNRINYWIFIGDPASSVEIYGITNKTEVKIRGEKGILYEQKGNLRTLVWTNENKGYGFALRTDDESIDLLAMAESTAEGEPLTPTRSESTVKALAQLGDYQPSYLPDGFVETGVMGSPIEEGGGWYSYVRKWYANKADNIGIYFEYESYVIDTDKGYTDNAQTAASFHIPKDRNGNFIGEETEINGMYAIASVQDVAWADPETHTVYHLYSEDVTGEELLKVARSIVENS